MTAASGQGPVTYGCLRRPQRAGLLGLGLVPTAIGFCGFVVAVLAMMTAGIVAGVLVLLGTVVVTGPLVYGGRDGRTGYERLAAMTMFALARRKGRTTYMTGPTGLTPDGRCRLPGLSAGSELLEAHDVYGRPFGVLVLPGRAHYTVVASVRATGDELVDQSTIDARVSQWGGWLAHLGKQPALRQAAVTVETAPDPGTRLANMLSRHVDPAAAPPFAAQTAAEVAQQYPSTAGVITTRVALTFSADEGAGRGQRSREEMVEYLGRQAPQLVDALRSAGAVPGPAGRLLTAADLADYVRVAFDPAVGQLVEEQRAAGGTGLSWTDAGPSYAREEPGHYVHDGGVSVSWQMREPPKGVFYDNTLKALLAPNAEIARKRVTIMYRPIPAERTAEVAQADVNHARSRATGRWRPVERDKVTRQAAEQAETEEARGAGLVQFGMVVTATVTDPARLPLAEAAVEGVARQSRIALRPAHYTQAVTFAAGLPIGLVLPEHTLVPRLLRESL